MPQPIQGPTLADVESNIREREKAIRGGNKGRISKAKLAELKRNSDSAGATQREKARQRAIYKEMRKYQTGKKGEPTTRRYNALFNESARIAKRARKRVAEKEAAAVKKAAKVKAAKKAVKKRAATAKKAAKKTARPAKKAAKKAARPVKKAAKKSR
jgi:hypothetical protein